MLFCLYLSAGNGEICKYAILFVFVTGVRFQAFTLGIVPQLERVVQCSGQNVFSVRRKFDKRNRWIVVVDQRLQTLSACCVPNAAKPVIAGRHNQRTVPIEVDGTDWIRVSGKSLQTFSCKPNIYSEIGNIPNTFRLQYIH